MPRPPQESETNDAWLKIIGYWLLYTGPPEWKTMTCAESWFSSMITLYQTNTSSSTLPDLQSMLNSYPALVLGQQQRILEIVQEPPLRLWCRHLLRSLEDLIGVSTVYRRDASREEVHTLGKRSLAITMPTSTLSVWPTWHTFYNHEHGGHSMYRRRRRRYSGPLLLSMT